MKLKYLAVCLAIAVGTIAIVDTSVAAGIVDSKHNLQANSLAATKFDGTTEICVFCHTPHGSASEAPLWNRIIGTASSLTPYTSTTMDGEAVLAGSPSLACLSCHDGTQAMNTVINATSSATDYGYNATGAPMSGTWTGAGIGGIMAGADNTVPNLGTNLNNDHPVAVPFAGGGLDDTPSVSEFGDSDFRVPDTGVIGGQQVWWLEFDPADGATDDTNDGTRTKVDLMLYTRNSTGFVECGSCHDPHNDRAQFLRAPSGNVGSQLCLACHNK
jgi:predicted CXXCH cytochrome family protein